MASLEDRVLALKKKIDILGPRRDRAAGAEETLRKELMEKHGLSTAEEADQAAEKAGIEADALEAEIQSLLQSTEEEFRDLLALARG